MSKRKTYQPALEGIEKAINVFDQAAVQGNDSFARKQYFELVDIVHTIKTMIIEEEANERRTIETQKENAEGVGQGQAQESTEIADDFDPTTSGC